MQDHVETNYDPDRIHGKYFHHRRIILNYILNSSSGYLLNPSSNPESNLGRCTLFKCTTGLKDIYPYKEILNNISEISLYEKNWVPLLSIYNKSIIRNEDFDEERDLMLKYDNIMENSGFTISEDDRIEKEEIIHRLSNIILKITPAGISYLKYITTHFEYYSSFASPNCSSVSD